MDKSQDHTVVVNDTHYTCVRELVRVYMYIGIKGWMTRQIFLAYQNQCVSNLPESNKSSY